MKAAVLHAAGKAPRYETFEDPVAGAGETVVEVLAASLKQVDKQIASGSHYASAKVFPSVCGIDGVGKLPSGQRVYFGGTRPPFGAMAERAVVRTVFSFPVPDGLSDEVAAAIPNPGVSAWLSLTYRGKLSQGDNLLVLGATGVTGRLAIQAAKLLGAGRVVAAGRNQESLRKLAALGADASIRLDVPDDELRQAFQGEIQSGGFQVVLDYLWGKPAQVFFEAITKREFSPIESETRFVQVGESAAPTISLNAATLRSAALTIMGTAGMPPREVLTSALQNVFDHAASGRLRIETERVSLAEVESAWNRDASGRRIVFVP
ncbi:Alcohol dehydrogenase, zinc-binding protein [Candidatus Koribacter versatilis Ellin345]|uniref:Alcohol dehydrogenase, zinc-binding protein n=1 Tax=Koribacter versatilis (strain Ellin345) TaxID=204669 RepID=Q1IP49_KORVE|nr:zinc-binding alcohol dehydrogenase family protein [Candidatus Koribacter versatilis]ABF41351.1 Alcohol dehydrogenase, zinc-binding protein [Candidatus Koribacter versatilis Ellin345]